MIHQSIPVNIGPRIAPSSQARNKGGSAWLALRYRGPQPCPIQRIIARCPHHQHPLHRQLCRLISPTSPKIRAQSCSRRLIHPQHLTRLRERRRLRRSNSALAISTAAQEKPRTSEGLGQGSLARRAGARTSAPRRKPCVRPRTAFRFPRVKHSRLFEGEMVDGAVSSHAFGDHGAADFYIDWASSGVPMRPLREPVPSSTPI